MVILCRCGKLGMQSGEVGNKTPQHWEGPVFICDKPTHAKDTDYTTIFIWVFPTIGVPKNGWWKIMENPIKMDDCRGTLFLEAPNIYIYTYIYIRQYQYKNPTHQDSPWDSMRPSCDWVCWHPTVIPAPSRDLGKFHEDFKRLSGFPRQWCGGCPPCRTT